MPRRRSSVPPAPGPGTGSGAATTTTTTRQPAPLQLPSPSSPPRAPPPAAAAAQLARADALARMTVELNLRAVASQAERLERDLRALVECTSRDRAFRATHEQRLEDMWREILAVKKRMAEFHERSAADLERCRGDAARSMDQLRGDVGQLRALVDDVSCALDKLPAAAPSSPTRDVKLRVRETLGSTRRWNRDHKTTRLADAVFVANYLKQQSKRDPPMAVLLQRALQRTRSRRAGGRARPQSLEQLCEGLAWRDVIDTVEEVLVRGEARVLKALR